MTIVENVAAAVDLQGIVVYLAIMGTFLTAVAWATYRDCQIEDRKMRVLATKAAPAAHAGLAVADVKQRKAA